MKSVNVKLRLEECKNNLKVEYKKCKNNFKV